MCQVGGGGRGGDEINHFGQSHKFADGNVHVVGAKRCDVRIGAKV
jgi:hypothetical protein